MGENCAQNCPILGRVEALEGQVDELGAQNASSHKDIYTRLGALERSEAVQEVHYKNIMVKLDKDIPAKIDGLSVKIEALEKKPGKRWELVVSSALSALVTGVVVYLLAGGGIG